MPQFDFYTILVQISWLTLSFGLLYFILNKTILKNLAQVIKMRQKLLDYRILLEKAFKKNIFSNQAFLNIKSFLEDLDTKIKDLFKK